MIEKQIGKQLCTLRTDNGGEFTSSDFNDYCATSSIRQELTAPYSSAQNGVAERMNRTIQDTARALLKQAGLHLSYWAEAVTMTTYLHNRLPGQATPSSTPYYLLFGRKPSISHIRMFRATAYAHLHSSQLKHAKLSDRTRKYVFIGFTDGIKAYKLYDPSTRQTIYSRSVTFDETAVIPLNVGTPTTGEPVGDLMSLQTTNTEVTKGSPPITDFPASESNLDQDHTSDHESESIQSFAIEEQADQPPPDVPVAPDLVVQPPLPPTRTLRPRASISAPVPYSPSRWSSSRAQTDWFTGDAVVTITETEPSEHADMFATKQLTKRQAYALAAATQELTGDPQTMTQAYNSADGDKWHKAV